MATPMALLGGRSEVSGNNAPQAAGFVDDELSRIRCHAPRDANRLTDSRVLSEANSWPDGSFPPGENSKLLAMDNSGICQRRQNR